MKEFKGTPGPWFFAAKHDDCEVRYVCGSKDYNGCNDVCTLYLGSAEEQHANANIIAAAPELLEELQFIVSTIEHNEGSQKWLSSAKSAIAKALGE